MNTAASQLSETTKTLIADALVWDDHQCMPLRPEDDSFLPQLQRCRDAGLDVVSLNVGFDAVPWDTAVLNLATMRRWVRQHEAEFHLVATVEDIDYCRANNKLGVLFDIEGGVSLNDHLPMVELYYDLGVRWMLFAYNLNNSLAGGCQDDNAGLTDFGRQVLREMERVGMVVCCSHTSYQSAREIMDMAENPVIFSHSNPRAVTDHYRNIPDDLIHACAKTGGVVALNGIGEFLGNGDDLVQSFVEHLDHVVQLVGADHVAIGTDYVFDQQELEDFLRDNPHMFDPDKYSGNFAMLGPEDIPPITESLVSRGYAESDIRKILGENHRRVAAQVWK